MAVSKVSLSIEEDVLAEARERAGRRELSAYVNEALQRQLQHDRLGELLAEMETEFGEFRVCIVEVCPDCRWNHMTTSFLLGDGKTRRRPRRQETVEDIYG